MGNGNDELEKIYKEINSIENKIENLQSELGSLKTKLDYFVQNKGIQNKEEYTIDPILEEELTSPITGMHDVLPDEFSSSEIPGKVNIEGSESVKNAIHKVGIIRPSLNIKLPHKSEEISPNKNILNIEKPIGSKSIDTKPTPPDIFDDVKNWVKSKIGNIPIEEFLGVNLLNKIGLIILVIGFSLFLRLAYDWIGPFTKIFGMFAIGAVTFYTGDRLYRNKTFSVFGLGLIASSFSLFYFTSYASFNLEATRIIPPDTVWIGFILLLITSGLIILASLRYKIEVLTSFAYFLAFLTISINEKADFNYFSMATVAILAVSLIGIMTVMRWKYLTGVGIIATYANYWLYAEGLPRNAEGYLLKASESGHNFYFESILYLLFFWIIFLISTFSMKIIEKKSERICNAINVVNAFSFFIMLGHLRPEPTEWGPFLLNTGMGITYIISAFVGRKLGREFLWKSSIIIGISLLTLAIPSKFSDYGHVFGWLMEGTILVILGILYKEVYLKNLGYLVLLLNLGRFFTLPYGDFYFSTNDIYPLLSFDMNRGLIYISMLFSFYGLILFLRKFQQNWSKFDKIAYNGFAILGSLTLFLFSFYLIQKPFQAYVLIPGSSLILFVAIYFKNRNLYYSSASLTVISLLSSLKLLFQDNSNTKEIHEIVCLFLILFGNAFHYFFGKQNIILKRFMELPKSIHRKMGNSLQIKKLLQNGELFLWVISITFISIALNEVSSFLHTMSLIVGSFIFVYLYKIQGQGIKQGIFLFIIAFIVSFYRFIVYKNLDTREFNTESWIAFTNTVTFWIPGIGILFYKEKLKMKKEVLNLISHTLISATTLIAMAIGRILFQDMFYLSFAAIYSLVLVWIFTKLKDEFCIYNSILLSWFSLFFGMGAMVLSKENPYGIYEYMNLITYTTSSVMITILSFKLIEKNTPRILSYLHSILSGICLILLVLPQEYRPFAFAVLHFGNLYFLFRFQIDLLYEYSYLTLGISVLSFLNHSDFPKSQTIQESREIILIFGYSILSILQTIYIFLRGSKSRDKYIYYGLNLLIYFWSIHITTSIEYSALFFAIFVYANSFLINRFEMKEILTLYYFPLVSTILIFLYLLLSNQSRVIETLNLESFILGLLTLLLLLRSVKDIENFKSKQLEYKVEKYGLETILTLVLFVEFILLTMTVVDLRWWSLIWTLEAMSFIVYGVFRNQPLIRYAGIGLIALAVIKVGFWDLQNLQENSRVLVLISIGGLFVAGSFLYAKYKEKLFKGN